MNHNINDKVISNNVPNIYNGTEGIIINKINSFFYEVEFNLFYNKKVLVCHFDNLKPRPKNNFSLLRVWKEILTVNGHKTFNTYDPITTPIFRANSTTGFSVGDPVYIISQDAIGIILDGATNRKEIAEWQGDVRTDYAGVVAESNIMPLQSVHSTDLFDGKNSYKGNKLIMQWLSMHDIIFPDDVEDVLLNRRDMINVQFKKIVDDDGMLAKDHHLLHYKLFN
jgi:hypothetical protein